MWHEPCFKPLDGVEVEQIVRSIQAISNYTYASGARKKE